MINFGLIGYGYWGPNYLRTIKDNDECSLEYCCDIRPEMLKVPEQKYKIKTTTNYKDILKDSKINAVVISTTATTHYPIVKEALLAGKDVLVEKPITTSSKEALELARLAEKEKRVLMVGHIFKFNSGVNKVKELIENKEIGNVLYGHAARTGLGPVRQDVNALWDLASHDISIFLHLFKEKPISVSAEGSCFLQKGIEDVVFVTMNFEDSVIANIHACWLDPYKFRKLTVVGDKKMVVFEDTSPTEPIRIFDKGVTYCERGADFAEFKTQVRDGDILIPKIKQSEPLKEEFNHFLKCVKERSKPISNGIDGYNVVKILESAQKSLKNSGEKVKIEFEN